MGCILLRFVIPNEVRDLQFAASAPTLQAFLKPLPGELTIPANVIAVDVPFICIYN